MTAPDRGAKTSYRSCVVGAVHTRSKERRLRSLVPESKDRLLAAMLRSGTIALRTVVVATVPSLRSSRRGSRVALSASMFGSNWVR